MRENLTLYFDMGFRLIELITDFGNFNILIVKFYFLKKTNTSLNTFNLKNMSLIDELFCWDKALRIKIFTKVSLLFFHFPFVMMKQKA